MRQKKEIYRGVIFYPEIPVGCMKCEQPNALVLTRNKTLCAFCYSNEQLENCIICLGIKPKAPIYWVCGVHYTNRLECCELFELTEDKKKEIMKEYEEMKLASDIRDKISQDLDVISEIIKTLS